MCKASIVAERTQDAKHGQNLEIGLSVHGLGAFHETGTPASECVTCVKDGTILSVKSVPLDLQKKYGIAAMVRAEFIETSHNVQDLLKFASGQSAYLSEFANRGITAYVGELELPQSTERTGIDDDAEIGAFALQSAI